MRCKVLSILTLALTTYILIGGAIFNALEGPLEEQRANATFSLLREFRNNNTCISDSEMDDILEVIYGTLHSGFLILDTGVNSTNTAWDLGGGVFFAATVVSTIGFGNLSPSSWTGRTFCMIYALIGIPLFLMIVTNLGQKLAGISVRLLNQSSYLRNQPRATRWVALTLNIVAGCILFIAIPAGIFHIVERWTFTEGVYFAFIALSTIGFGDYVTGTRSSYNFRTLYRLFVSTWLLCGLAWLSMMMSSMQGVMEETVHSKCTGNDVKEKTGSSNADIDGGRRGITENTPQDDGQDPTSSFASIKTTISQCHLDPKGPGTDVSSEKRTKIVPAKCQSCGCVLTVAQ